LKDLFLVKVARIYRLGKTKRHRTESGNPSQTYAYRIPQLTEVNVIAALLQWPAIGIKHITRI
jgi:hypothetical protein